MVLLSVLLPVHGTKAQSLDIALAGHGLSVGNSKRITGVRLNAVDRHVEEINGLNLTLWNPGQSPDAVFNGIALGLIGTKAQRINGIALSGIGVNASDHLRGFAAGTLGVGSGKLTGVAVGLIMVDVKEHFRGINVSGFWTGSPEQFDGLALSLGAATARNVRGATVGGIMAGGDQSLTGVALSPGGVYSARFRGVAVGGLGAGFEDMNGIALSLGGIGGEGLDGILLARLGLGAVDKIRGIAIGSLLAFAPEVTGLMVGGLNGLYIDRIDLEDFLHFNMVNERFTGLSIGLVNYSARLKGVQLGLVNYAGNNPRWLRLLPLVNLHL
jgi:hypothetical protein